MFLCQTNISILAGKLKILEDIGIYQEQGPAVAQMYRQRNLNYVHSLIDNTSFLKV